MYTVMVKTVGLPGLCRSEAVALLRLCRSFDSEKLLDLKY